VRFLPQIMALSLITSWLVLESFEHENVIGVG